MQKQKKFTTHFDTHCENCKGHIYAGGKVYKKRGKWVCETCV